MNTINFSNSFKQYPLATEDLIFLQEMINSASGLAKLAGSGNYILSGCENTSGTNYSAGIMIIAGEVIPFHGGILQSTVRIKTVSYDKEADYSTYVGARITRYAEFGSNVGNTETYTWTDFIKLLSIEELQTNYATKEELNVLSALLKPVGDITMFASSQNIPTGHFLCDGRSLNRSDYPALFAVIGTSFGSVSETTFNIPDLRGRFIVGYDDTAVNLPPNVTDGKEINYGKVGNRGGKPNVLLSSAQSGLRKHRHLLFKISSRVENWFLRDSPLKVVITDGKSSYSDDNNKYALQHNNDDAEADAGLSGSSSELDASETHENRPPYYVLAYIIKVV